MTEVKQGGSFHRDSMHEDISSFQLALEPYLGELSRDLPWRHLSSDPQQRFYEVLVSEVMLQQTQVKRVSEKYAAWLHRFPTLHALAHASFPGVLAEWSGLGYSRRAKYLCDIAKGVLAQGVPSTPSELTSYKGIGPNTAGAIFVYAQNEPLLFIETNIRSVLFHHFFADDTDVTDKELLAVLERILDKRNPRLWYWAVMDYGTDLKKKVRNIHQSRHYKKQSKFEGSDRQLRSRLLKKLLHADWLSFADALDCLEGKQYIVDALLKEGMIVQKGEKLHFPE